MDKVSRTLAGAAFLLVSIGVAESLGADPEAIALRESKGIVRQDQVYMLRAEAEIKSKLIVLRSKAAEFNIARQSLAEIEQDLATIPLLDQQINDLHDQINDHDFAIRQYPPINRGGRIFYGSSQQEDAECRRLQASRSNLDREARKTGTERNRLFNLGLGRKLGPAKQAFEERSRAAMAALRDMREAADRAATAYNELREAPEVKAALTKLGKAKFGPTPEFAGRLQEVERFEKSVGMKPAGVPLKPEPSPPSVSPKARPDPESDADSYLQRAQNTEKNGKDALELYKAVVKRYPDSKAA